MNLRAAAPIATLLASLLFAAPAAATVTLPPRTLTLPTSGSFLYLKSDPGDYVGQGQERLFTPSTSSMYASLRDGTFGARIELSPTSSWSVTLAAPAGTPLTVGSYTDAVEAGSQAAGSPGLDVSGEGRACGQLMGQFDVTQVAISALGDITRFDAVFEQHCGTWPSALYGRVHIESAAPAPGSTLPPGSINVPKRGNFLYMGQSSVGSGGFEQLYTLADTTITGTLSSDLFQGSAIQSSNVHLWYVDIAAPLGGLLVAGSYPNAVRAISRTATSPGLDVRGDGIGCNVVNGSFTVDVLEFAPTGELIVFQSTFHYYCDNSLFQRHGRIRIEHMPPPVLGVTLDSVGKVSNKTGIAVLSGTVSCSRSVTVAIGGVLSQVKPDHTLVEGQVSGSVECVAPQSPWTAEASAAMRFGASSASASITATNCDDGCVSAPASGSVKFNASK